MAGCGAPERRHLQQQLPELELPWPADRDAIRARVGGARPRLTRTPLCRSDEGHRSRTGSSIAGFAPVVCRALARAEAAEDPAAIRSKRSHNSGRMPGTRRRSTRSERPCCAAGSRAGCPAETVTLHRLRRTWAMLALTAGRDARWAIAQMGHTDARLTLQVYVQVRPAPACGLRACLAAHALRRRGRALEPTPPTRGAV
jgi:integrase